MEQLNEKITNILSNKYDQIKKEYHEKEQNRKMTNIDKKDIIDYNTQKTFTKIKQEQERKLKSSKTYKKINNYNNE